MASVRAPEPGDVDQVSDDGGGGLLRAGAGAVVHRQAGGVAADEDAVHRAIDPRHQARQRHERRMHAQLDAFRPPPRDRQRFDGIAEARGEALVDRLYRGNAFDGDLVELQRHAEGEAGEQGQLVRSVESANVERRVCLGIAERLRFLDGIVEGKPRIAHPGEDEVAGAIDDAGQPADLIGGQPFAQGLDDGDADGHRAFVGDGDALRTGGGEDFLAVHGQQGFVGGDDVLAVSDGVEHQMTRRRAAADSLDDDVDVRMANQRRRIGDQIDFATDDAVSACQCPGR